MEYTPLTEDLVQQFFDKFNFWTDDMSDTERYVAYLNLQSCMLRRMREKKEKLHDAAIFDIMVCQGYEVGEEFMFTSKTKHEVKIFGGSEPLKVKLYGIGDSKGQIVLYIKSEEPVAYYNSLSLEAAKEQLIKV